MNLSTQYFHLARKSEKEGMPSAALLQYISSLLSGFHSGNLPYQAAEKIRRLQRVLRLSDDELLSCVHSYGTFSDFDCRSLVRFAITGNLSGIKDILSSYAGS